MLLESEDHSIVSANAFKDSVSVEKAVIVDGYRRLRFGEPVTVNVDDWFFVDQV